MGDTPDANRNSPQPSPGSESPTHWTFFDSDGEEYDVYSDGTHEMTDKEWREYRRQVEESGGYDVKSFPDAHAFGIIEPIKLTDENIGCFNDYASRALDEFNRNEGKQLQFKSVQSVNTHGLGGIAYFITFEVMDEDQIKVFQARVLILYNFKADDFKVEEIRPKPTA